MRAALSRVRLEWALVAIAVLYVSVSNRDVKLAAIPLKLVLTGLALAVWWWRRPGERTMPWWRALLVFAVGVPAFGGAVALLRVATDDPAQADGVRNAIEEGSRFVYALLALPLADWARGARDGREADRLWLWPVTVLALISWGLYVAHLLGVHFPPSGEFGPWQGDFGVDPSSGWFRAFMVTHVLFVPAVVLLFARLSGRATRASDASLFLVFFVAVFVSHGRGVWVGILIGCAVVIALRAVIARPRLRLFIPVAAVALAVAVVGFSVPTLVDPVVGAFTGGKNEQSAGLRLQQAPKLLDGAERHPIIGSGLGGTLPSGYERNKAEPWSFELAYLQLLFQVGAIGLLLVFAWPLVALRAATRRIVDAGRDDERVVAGIGALAGLLVTCGTNPYLITSAGTLALAITVVLSAGLAGRAAGTPAPSDRR